MAGMRKAAPGIAVVLLLAPSLYLLAYWLVLDRNASSNIGMDRRAEYRIGGTVAEVFFWPANQVDRKLRPEHWEAIPW
jgi:hypothetical protein